ncbi:hypothetical protein Pse7367_0387 [Thalassoporum mexicanum PCC 7367]|uniref:oligosaccharide flippase family protein n=1 Tax=Thalassoporum mexicanum TaxID=3457544 RepID=UPI00029FAF20|nr:oligosaccharide flippase family protein [Pseudanabaena sp. PCC 7367]AFY68698.1 hypothetical protein Pse7367_0387 [Pseudanabaena sp. PCC 7367]
MQFIQAIIEQLQTLRQTLTASITKPDGDRNSWLAFSGFIDLGFFVLALSALARSFFDADLGLVAILWATHAILRIFSQVFIKSIVTPAIVNCDGQDLNQVCNAAYRFNWLLALVLFLVQGAIAFPLANLYGSDELAWPLLTMALGFAIYPQGTICLALRQRHNREQQPKLSPSQITSLNQTQVRLINLAESSLNYGAIALLLYSGLGLWAIVVATILAALVAQSLRRKSYFWQPNPKIKLRNWRLLFKFIEQPFNLALPVIAVLEINLAYLIVAWAIDLNALGRFFIAINAGLIITLKIINLGTGDNIARLAQLSVSFRGLRQLYIDSYRQIALLTIPLLIIQSTLAPFYVPLIFSDTWNPTIPAMLIMLWAALPQPFAAVGTQLFTTTNRSQFNLYWRSGFLIILLGVVVFSSRWDLPGIAIGISIAYGIVHGVFAIVANRLCLTRLA